MLNFEIQQDTTTPMLMRVEMELVGGMTTIWHAVGKAAVGSIRRNFEVGGRPSWVPLSASTIRRKGHDRPLIRTGALMKGTQYRLTGKGVELFNNVPYGAMHQYGEGNVPARPWMVVPPEDEFNFVSIVNVGLQKLMGG